MTSVETLLFELSETNIDLREDKEFFRIIKNNTSKILMFLMENNQWKQIFENSLQIQKTTIKLIAVFFDSYYDISLDKDSVNYLVSAYRKYIDNNILLVKFPIETCMLLSSMFNFLVLKSNGETIFKNILENVLSVYSSEGILNQETFLPIYTFDLYLAYQSNDQLVISKYMTKSYIIEKNNVDSEIIENYIIFTYYKGLIYLSRMDYNNAILTFLQTIKNYYINQNFYHFLQIEAIKRLSILIGLCDENLSNILNNCLKQHSVLFKAKDMSIYENIKELIIKKEVSNEEFLKILIANKYILKSDKTLVSLNILKTIFIFYFDSTIGTI